MIPGLDAALDRLAGAVAPLGRTETVPVDATGGRVLAAPVLARIDHPRADVSAMDGYAVQWDRVSVGDRLDVVAEARPGQPSPVTVGPGQAVRLFTGAPIPAGATGVIIQENVERDSDAIVVARAFGPGRHIRARGGDFAAGDMVLAAGTLLSPQAVLAAAGADAAALDVAARPRVRIIATGDELVAPGEAAVTGYAIPDSIGCALTTAIAGWGGDVLGRERGADDPDHLVELAGTALADADVVVVTGGASVGDHDHARAMFAPHGLSLLIDRVAIKPGKPVWVGRADAAWIVGLPGNPVSAMVTARLFLAPLLAGLQGRPVEALLRWRRLPLGAPLPATGDRETLWRARWDCDGLLPVTNQDSAAQRAFGEADWLVRAPAGQGSLAPGDVVQTLAL